MKMNHLDPKCKNMGFALSRCRENDGFPPEAACRSNVSLRFVLQIISAATNFAFGMQVHLRIATNIRTNLHSESMCRHLHVDSSENAQASD